MGLSQVSHSAIFTGTSTSSISTTQLGIYGVLSLQLDRSSDPQAPLGFGQQQAPAIKSVRINCRLSNRMNL